jgi:hypothetical protein
MKRYIFTVLLVFFALSSFAEYLDNRAYYPIVTKANGSGGTKWLTEVSMTNPQNHMIRISIQLAQNGTTKNWYYDLGAGKTATWSDFLGVALNRSGNAALYLYADEEHNPGYSEDCLEFISSVRVYNSGGSSGTFGQEIPPADVFEDFLGTYTGFFTGVQNHGTAGVNGFRTNIGFWHTGFSNEVLRVRLFDANGNQIWAKNVTVEKHKPYVMSLPKNVQNGSLAISPMGEYVDCAVYISVVDNKSGDGVYRGVNKVNDSDMASCGFSLSKDGGSYLPCKGLTREEAEARIHRLVTGQPLPEDLEPPR